MQFDVKIHTLFSLIHESHRQQLLFLSVIFFFFFHFILHIFAKCSMAVTSLYFEQKQNNFFWVVWLTLMSIGKDEKKIVYLIVRWSMPYSKKMDLIQSTFNHMCESAICTPCFNERTFILSCALFSPHNFHSICSIWFVPIRQTKALFENNNYIHIIIIVIFF